MRSPPPAPPPMLRAMLRTVVDLRCFVASAHARTCACSSCCLAFEAPTSHVTHAVRPRAITTCTTRWHGELVE